MMFWLSALTVVMVDQWTKSWVMDHFTLNASKEMFGEFIKLTYTRNPGIAFSLFADGASDWRHPLLVGVTFVVIAFLVFSWKKFEAAGPEQAMGYGLILGGAIGNLIDRFQYQAVIDFIDVGVGLNRWPVFNVADSAICVGAVVALFLGMFFDSSHR